MRIDSCHAYACGDVAVSKVAKNLFLDPEVIARGAEYGRRHGTTLSRLVSGFLQGLELEGSTTPLSPAVRRLLGAAVPEGRRRHARKGKKGQARRGAGEGREDYHAYLTRKYASR